MTKTDETIHEKINISLKESLFPIILLIVFLSFNVYVYGDDAMGGSNQFILLVGAAAGIALGIYKGFKFSNMMTQVAENLKSVKHTLEQVFLNLGIESIDTRSKEFKATVTLQKNKASKGSTIEQVLALSKTLELMTDKPNRNVNDVIRKIRQNGA
jgi:hypothetical protein